MTIGEKIKQRRIELGLSRQMLANQVNSYRQKIFRIETQSVKKSYNMHIAICQALNLNPETLEPNELPKRSAWDDIKDGADIVQTGGWQGCHVILFGEIEKYKDELKRLPAKD